MISNTVLLQTLSQEIWQYKRIQILETIAIFRESQFKSNNQKYEIDILSKSGPTWSTTLFFFLTLISNLAIDSRTTFYVSPYFLYIYYGVR